VNGGIGGASEDGSDASVDGTGGEFVVVGCRAGAVGAGGGLGNWKAGAAEVPVVVALVGVSSIWFVPFIVGASICVGVSIKAAVVGESVGGLISCVGVVAPTPPSPLLSPGPTPGITPPPVPVPLPSPGCIGVGGGTTIGLVEEGAGAIITGTSSGVGSMRECKIL